MLQYLRKFSKNAAHILREVAACSSFNLRKFSK